MKTKRSQFLLLPLGRRKLVPVWRETYSQRWKCICSF